MSRVLDALTNYVEEKAALDKACQDCDSSPDYFLRDQFERVRKAGDRFEVELQEFILTVVGRKDP